MSCSPALSDPEWLPVDAGADLNDIAVIWAAMEALAVLPASPEDRAALEQRRAEFREQLRDIGLTEHDLRTHARRAHGHHPRHLRVVEDECWADELHGDVPDIHQCPDVAGSQIPPAGRQQRSSWSAIDHVQGGTNWASKAGGPTLTVRRKKHSA